MKKSRQASTGPDSTVRPASKQERRNGKTPSRPHHTRRLSNGGPDHPQHVGAICPNCHQEVHFGAKGRELNEQLEVYLAEIEKDS